MSKIADRFRNHFNDFESPHRRIAFDFLWIVLFVILGKAVAVGKEMAIAWRYGTNELVDAFVLVFNLAVWPVSIWLGILSLVLVPVVARIRNETPEELPRFQGEFFGFSILVGLALGILVWCGLVATLKSSSIGLSNQVSTTALGMVNELVLFVPFGVIACFLSAWMIAYRKHVSTMFEGIPSATILLALILPKNWIGEPLLWGTVVGYGLYMSALILVERSSRGLVFPRFGFRSPAWPFFWGGLGIMLLAQLLTSIALIVDQLFAARLEQDALSVMGYANRVMAVVFAVGAIAISRACLPVFAELGAQSPARLKLLVLRWSLWIFCASWVVVYIGWFMSTFIVEVLFQRGAFTSEDTLKVSQAFQWSLVQIPFYACALILSNFVASQKWFRVLLFGTTIGLVVKIFSALLLTNIFDLNGLLVSAAPSYMASLLFFLYVIKIDKMETKN